MFYTQTISVAFVIMNQVRMIRRWRKPIQNQHQIAMKILNQVWSMVKIENQKNVIEWTAQISGGVGILHWGLLIFFVFCWILWIFCWILEIYCKKTLWIRWIINWMTFSTEEKVKIKIINAQYREIMANSTISGGVVGRKRNFSIHKIWPENHQKERYGMCFIVLASDF